VARRRAGRLSDVPSRTRPRPKPGPGGVDDGLPQTPDGEPLLHRWFAMTLLVLVPVALGVTIWAFALIPETEIPPAERRPPGDEIVTHDRGDAVLNEVREAEPGPRCAEDLTLVGDASARAALRRALSATCQLLERHDDLAPARAGLARWIEEDGIIRMGVFELTGVESSARHEDGHLVIELNAKFQFEAGSRATPVIVHELVHLAQGAPGRPVTAEGELAAAELQHAACERLAFPDAPPRGCDDVEELLGSEDPLGELRDAGFPGEEEVADE
jgi:hypothetical protein